MKLELNTPACITISIISICFVLMFVLTAGETDIIDLMKLQMLDAQYPFCETPFAPVDGVEMVDCRKSSPVE